jgi:hypothetical protein
VSGKVGAERWAVEYIKYQFERGVRGDALNRAMIWSDWEFEMIVVTGKGEPLWAADGKYLTEWWVGGPAFYVEVQEAR